MRLTPTFQESLPPATAFSYNDENERIGLLIRRIIPQKHFGDAKTTSAFASFKKATNAHAHERDLDIDKGDVDEFCNQDLMSPSKCPPIAPTAPSKPQSILPRATDEIVLFGGTLKVQAPPPPISSSTSSDRNAGVLSSSSAPPGPSSGGSSGSSGSSGRSSGSSSNGGGIWDAFKSNAPSKPAQKKRARVEEERDTDVQAKTRKVAVKPALLSKVGKQSDLAVQPVTHNYTKEDFAGGEKFLRNAGRQSKGLEAFLQMFREGNRAVGLSLVWCDLTSNHTPTTSPKFCKPSQACDRWYCSCERYIRVDLAYRPVIGAVVCLPEQPRHCYFLPLALSQSDISVATDVARNFTLPFPFETSVKERWEAFYEILSNSRKKVMYHTKLALLPIIANLRILGLDASQISNVVDPRVGGYIASERDLISEEALELQALCKHYGINGDTEDLSNSFSGTTCGMVVAALGQIHTELQQVTSLNSALTLKLQGMGSLNFFENLEMKVVLELAKLELRGIGASPLGFSLLTKQLEDKVEEISIEAQREAGMEFNLASPEQVSNVLFGRLKIPPPESTSTKGKHYSTSEETLKSKVGEHPVVQMILDYRACKKVVSTFDWRQFLYHSNSPQDGDASIQISSLTTSYSERHNHVASSQMSTSPQKQGHSPQHKENRRIHPRWNLGFTRTGRLSCSLPNLQQVPKKFTVHGMDINVRALFKPHHEGYVLLAADYTQMEMKVLACAARDSGLLSLFQQQAETQGDVYKMMSGQIHQKPLDMVTPHERSAAKTIALGIIYGMGPEQTAARLSITFGAACAIIKKFHALFPGVSKFISATKSRARANGFVATVGRNRRYLPDITSTDAQKRATAERQSVNSIIQGSASEMIKLAMIEMGAEVSREDWTGAEPPELVASIHDELLYVVHEDDVPALVSLLKHVMEDSVPTQFGLQLRFSVDVQSGPSWGEMAPYKE